MIPPKYKFYLQIEQGTRQEAHPIYKDDTSIDLSTETNQRFFRRTISSKIDFILDDYDLIMSASLGDEIYLDFEISTDFGITYVPYWRAKFVKSDCTINYDDRRISVQPVAADAYASLIDGMEREFNIIELAPELQSLRIRLRPMVQTYILGDDHITCFSPGLFWSVDCTEVNSASTIKGTYKFGFDTAFLKMELTGTPSYDVTGTYLLDERTENYENASYQLDCKRVENFYAVRHERININGTYWHYFRVVDLTHGDAVLYEYRSTTPPFDGLSFTFTNVGGTGTLKGAFSIRHLYARLVCDVDKVMGQSTSARPSSDIVDIDLKYNRLLPLSDSVGYQSQEFTTDPTEWGKRENTNDYYLPPDVPNRQYFQPISQDLWNDVSYWVRCNIVLDFYEQYASREWWMNDAYTIQGCIKVLLAEIAPSIQHEATSEYSEFLYGASNPITNEFFRVFLTQKTNILRGKYSEPATKAMTSFSQIMSILRSAFGLYWYVDGTKLKIEHISWFQNGGSYASDIRTVGYDLTTLRNIRNKKPWCYGQNSVTFEKEQMARFYKYSWMDDVTEPFEGQQIEVDNKGTDASKTEELRVDATSDVDYMLMYPSNFSNDGFALLIGVKADALLSTGISAGTKGNNNDYSTPLYPVDGQILTHTGTLKLTAIGGGMAELATFDADSNYIGALSLTNITSATTSVETFTLDQETADIVAYIGFRMISGSLSFNVEDLVMDGAFALPFKTLTYGNNVQRKCQNGIAAMAYLQPNFLTYEMPASRIIVNGSATTAKGLSKRKMQEITFPSDAVNIDTTSLVKTLVGIGEISKISLNLSSRIIKATLRHDNI